MLVCETENVLPPAVMELLRGADVELVATEYATVPEPVPLVAPVRLIHETDLLAVQVHALPLALIEKLPLPPFALIPELVGVRENVQPDCVTVYVLLAIVIVPVREAVLAVEATV